MASASGGGGGKKQSGLQKSFAKATSRLKNAVRGRAQKLSNARKSR